MMFIIGPCAIEDKEHALFMSLELKRVQEELRKIDSDVEIVYKSCFNKANRTKHDSFRGVGLEEGLKILAAVKRESGLRVTSDIHSIDEAEAAGEVVDIIQIPHSLCRYTDIIEAAARTGSQISVKKGAFMSCDDVQHVYEKISLQGNDKPVIMIERGTQVGSNETLVDMRNFKKMKINKNIITCIDASHPSDFRDEIEPLALAGAAAGAEAVFIEVHHDPKKAPCDGKRMMYLSQIQHLLVKILKMKQLLR